MLGITDNRLAHEMRRHPDGVPEPDAHAEGANGKTEPLWLPRAAEWQAWRASFPGRTGRPRKAAPSGPPGGSSRDERPRTGAAREQPGKAVRAARPAPPPPGPGAGTPA